MKRSARRIPLTAIRRAAKAARSGLKRYPRAIVHSIRSGARRAPEPCRPPAEFPDISGYPLAAVWLGHASVLLRLGGMNILADPVFSHRIGPRIGPVTMGLSRLCPLPAGRAQLPPIDLILITHAHFDHLDKPTLRSLASRDTTVITARRTKRLIPRGFGRVMEVDWEEEVDLGPLSVGTLRPAHWGARTAVDRRRGFNSYFLHDRANSVLVAGDTAFTDAFDTLAKRCPTLAAMGIGSYEPWEHAHATPEQAWAMFSAAKARHLLPIHHSTFPLGDEHPAEPMTRLLAAAGDEAHRVIRARPGALWASPRAAD